MNELRMRHARLLHDRNPATPCLTIDLDVVAARYHALRAVLPQAQIHYAVKANPHPAIIATLVALDSYFDAASPAEIALCPDRVGILGIGRSPSLRARRGRRVAVRAPVALVWITGAPARLTLGRRGADHA